MGTMDFITEGNIQYEKTLNLKEVLSKKVISKNGLLIGKVSEIRMSNNGMNVQGIVVSRGFLKNRLYISKSYIDKLTDDSVILKIDPFLMSRGLKIVTSEGEVIGKAVDFIRKDLSNDITAIVAYSFLRRKFNIPTKYVKSKEYSIILKPHYEPTKKYFW